MSTLAVFIALGGSSYAAVKISGANLKNRSISAGKVKRNTLTGREIRESRLGRVPRAPTADRPRDATAALAKPDCPPPTFLSASVCVERTARPATPYLSAVLECLEAGRPSSTGRRLPTHGELRDALTAISLAPGGELTANVYPSSTSSRLDVLVIVDQVGGFTLVPDKAPEGSRQFRCVTEPTN